MSIASISSAYDPNAAATSAVSTKGTGPMGEMHQLSKALRTGDLDAAKQAYANILKNPPPGATWNPDSAFAKLGQALKSGDIDQAKSIAQEAVKEARANRTQNGPVRAPREQPGATPAAADVSLSAGSSTGGLLNLVA